MKKLRVLKKDVLVFNICETHDSRVGQTYKMFTGAYILRFKEGEMVRIYLEDLKIDYKRYHSFNSHDDPHNLVKQWLNKNSNLSIRYMSEFKNIIVHQREISRKEFKLLEGYKNF